MSLRAKRSNLFFLVLVTISLVSCSPATPAVTPTAIRIYYTAATKPWLLKAYTCAGQNVIDAQLVPANVIDPATAYMTMRIGEVSLSTFPAYQIGSDTLQVIGNPHNPLKSLTLVQVQDIFTGRIQNWKDLQGPDEPIEVWVFAPDEDVEQLFEQKALSASPVTTLARLAVSPDEMAAAVAKDSNAIGLLTESWKAEGVTNLYTVSTEPVLVYTPSQPQGTERDLISCLQK